MSQSTKTRAWVRFFAFAFPSLWRNHRSQKRRKGVIRTSTPKSVSREGSAGTIPASSNPHSRASWITRSAPITTGCILHSLSPHGVSCCPSAPGRNCMRFSKRRSRCLNPPKREHGFVFLASPVLRFPQPLRSFRRPLHVYAHATV